MSNTQSLVPAAQYLAARNNELIPLVPDVDRDTARRYLWRQINAINQIMQQNPSLMSANKESTKAAFGEGVMLGLEFGSLKEAHLVPYGGKTQLIIGFRGLLKLVENTGIFSKVVVRNVYDHDSFKIVYGLDENLIHEPAMKPLSERGAYRCSYVVFHYKDRSISPYFEVMYADEMEKIKEKSKSTAWNEWTDEMYLKSALKRACKRVPQSAQLSQALEIESALEENRQPVIDVVDAEVVTEPPPAPETKADEAHEVLDAQPETEMPPVEENDIPLDASENKLKPWQERLHEALNAVHPEAELEALKKHGFNHRDDVTAAKAKLVAEEADKINGNMGK